MKISEIRYCAVCQSLMHMEIMDKIPGSPAKRLEMENFLSCQGCGTVFYRPPATGSEWVQWRDFYKEPES